MLRHSEKYCLQSAIPICNTRCFSALRVVNIAERHLEGEPALAGVADFVQVGVAGELDHRRRSAHQDDAVVARGRQVLPHHVFTDEALAVLPV